MIKFPSTPITLPWWVKMLLCGLALTASVVLFVDWSESHQGLTPRQPQVTTRLNRHNSSQRTAGKGHFSDRHTVDDLHLDSLNLITPEEPQLKTSDLRALANEWLSSDRAKSIEDSETLELFLAQLDALPNSPTCDLLCSFLIERLIEIKPDFVLRNLGTIDMSRLTFVGIAFWEQRFILMQSATKYKDEINCKSIVGLMTFGAQQQGCSAIDLRDLLQFSNSLGTSVSDYSFSGLFKDLVDQSCRPRVGTKAPQITSDELFSLAQDGSLENSAKMSIVESGLQHWPDTFLSLLTEDKITIDDPQQLERLANGFAKGAIQGNPIVSIQLLSAVTDNSRREVFIRSVVRQWLEIDSYGATNAISAQLSDTDLQFAAVEICKWSEKVGDQTTAQAWQAIGGKED